MLKCLGRRDACLGVEVHHATEEILKAVIVLLSVNTAENMATFREKKKEKEHTLNHTSGIICMQTTHRKKILRLIGKSRRENR